MNDVATYFGKNIYLNNEIKWKVQVMPLLNIHNVRFFWISLFQKKCNLGTPQTNYPSFHLDIEVEGTIFAFGFSKKYDISLLSIECRVLDRCRAFDRLACVDAHLCIPAGDGKNR